jgi:RecA-family ATPase
VIDAAKFACAIAQASEAREPIIAALTYARAGLPVFPCSQDKAPLTHFGFKDATTEIGQIRNWWSRWPRAMIGVRTGRESGVFVLDVDVDTEQNIDGFVALAVLEKRHGNLSETLRSVTPRGGSHYYFYWHEGIKNSAGKLGDGLDVRGEGGYVILPPSGRVDGKCYDWAETSAPAPIEAPAWLIELLTAHKEKPGSAQQTNGRFDGTGNAGAYARAALESECAAVAVAKTGMRNATLNRAAFCLFQFVASGLLPEHEVRNRLFSAAATCGLVRDDGAEAVRATIESGTRAGLRQPRADPESGNNYGNGASHADAKETDIPPLTFCDIGAWASQQPLPREWAVRDVFPLRNVALLSGEGAVGKSILLMQLGVAQMLGKDWLSMLPEPGPFLYFNAEDEEEELHRRFADIAAHYSASVAELKGHLHLLALAGKDPVLGYPARNGLIKPTTLYDQLLEAACDLRPKSIGLDTSADIFAGNENDRSQVRQFIGLMRGLAIAANTAVIIAGHPSLTGINSGTGLSGSTAWHNSVRARAYMRPLKIEDGDEPDQDLRVLDFMKSNYGPVTESLTLRWRNGVFIPEPKTGSLEKLAAQAKAEHVFLKLLERLTTEGRRVGEKPGHSYAPSKFAREPEAKSAGLKKEALAEAMRRLFAEKKIQVETYGKPSNPHYRIAAGPPV